MLHTYNKHVDNSILRKLLITFLINNQTQINSINVKVISNNEYERKNIHKNILNLLKEKCSF